MAGNPFDDLIPRPGPVQNAPTEIGAALDVTPGTTIVPGTAERYPDIPSSAGLSPRQPMPGTLVFGQDIQPALPAMAQPPLLGAPSQPRTPTSMFEKLGVSALGTGIGGSYEAIGQGLQQLAQGPTVPATFERADVFQNTPSRLGTVRQAGPGVADTGRAVAEYGKGIREAQPQSTVPTYQEIYVEGQPGQTARNLGTYIWESALQAAGSTVPMLAAGAVTGPVGALGAGWTMGVGQMRRSVEDERVKIDKAAQAAMQSGNVAEAERLAQIASRLDPKTQAQLIYAAGSVIGLLDSLFPASMFVKSAQTEAVKKLTAEYVTKSLTTAALSGMAKEGTTETLQQATEVLAIAKAKGAQAALEYLQALNDNRVEIIDAGLRGGFGGSAISGVGKAGSLVGERDRGQSPPTPEAPNQPQERIEPQLPWLSPEAVATPPVVTPEAQAAAETAPPATRGRRKAAEPAVPANPFADLVPANQNEQAPPTPEWVTAVADAYAQGQVDPSVSPQALLSDKAIVSPLETGQSTGQAPQESITLYRGEAPGAENNPMRPARSGQNWTNTLENAQAYAGEGGNVFAVTVPADRVGDIQRKFDDPSEMRLPPDLADRSRWQQVEAQAVKQPDKSAQPSSDGDFLTLVANVQEKVPSGSSDDVALAYKIATNVISPVTAGQSINGDPVDHVALAKAAILDGRKDIAELMAWRARRAVNNDAKPGVPVASPKYATIADKLRSTAEAQARLADELEAVLSVAAPAASNEIAPGIYATPTTSKNDDRTRYEITNANGDVIGNATVGDSQGRFSVKDVRIAPQYQRQGVATALYDRIERDFGRKLQEDNSQTDASRAFWDDRAGRSAPKAAPTAIQPMRVVTPDGSMEINAVPEVVELADLKRAEGALQPRDRSRSEYAQETRERAANLDPQRLQPSRTSDTGAPIVAADGTVLSGNGRTMSIEQAYRDRELAGVADAYRRSLGKAAEGMREPVLVMRAASLTPQEATRFADLSNRTGIAQMSATERALRDAQAMGLDGIALYEGGNFDAPQNQRFMRDFMTRAVTAAEMPSVSREGQLTLEGVARMRAAVLAAAYGDADVLARMLESTDDNVRSITAGLLDAAPRMAQLRAGIASGEVDPDMDPVPALMGAVRTISDLRSRKVAVQQWLAQSDAFGRDPIVEAWVKSFYYDDSNRAKRQEKVALLLNDYAAEAVLHRPGGLFADETTTADVLNVARRKNDASEADIAPTTGPMGEAVPKGRTSKGRRSDGASGQRPSEGDDVLAAIQSAPSRIEDEVRTILKDARDYEDHLVEEGSSPKTIADAFNKRYGSAVTAEQIESGNVWWRRMKGERERSYSISDSFEQGVLPPSEAAALAEFIVSESPMLDGVAAPMDVDAKPASPQRARGVSGGSSPGPRLTADQRQAAVALAQQGLSSRQIASQIQQQTGAYVRSDLVDAVIADARAKVDRSKASARSAAKRRAYYDSPEFREASAARMREIMARPEMQSWAAERMRGMYQRPDAKEWAAERGRKSAEARGMTVWSPAMVERINQPDMRTKSPQQKLGVLKSEFPDAASKLTLNAVRQKMADLGYTNEGRKGGVPAGKFGWSPETDQRLAELMTEAANATERATILNKEFGGSGVPSLSPKAVSKRWDKIKDSVLRSQGEEPMFAAGGWDASSWLDWIKGKPDVDATGTSQAGRPQPQAGRSLPGQQSGTDRTGSQGAETPANGTAVGISGTFRLRGLTGRILDGPPNPQGLRQGFVFLHPEKAWKPDATLDSVTLKVFQQVPNWTAKAHVSETEPGVWALEGIAVRKNKQRGGLGSELLDVIEREIGPVSDPQVMSPSLYGMWKKREAGGASNVTTSVDDYVAYRKKFYSPEMIREQLKGANEFAALSDSTIQQNIWRKKARELSDLVDKLPPEDDILAAIQGSNPSLDLSPEARKQRAEDMGFDTSEIAYRGLTRPYDGAKTNYYQMFTSNPWEASEYAMANPMGRPNVIASYIRKGRNLEIDAMGRPFNRVQVQHGKLPADMRGKLDTVSSIDEIAHAARLVGYDTVTVRNVIDNATGEVIAAQKPASSKVNSAELDAILAELGPVDIDAAPPQIDQGYTGVPPDKRGPVTVNVVFDPAKNARGVNATFDPSQEASADLMAAVNGAKTNLRQEAKRGLLQFKRPVAIPQNVVDGVRRALEPLMPMVPPSVNVGVLTRIAPIKSSIPNVNAEMTFEMANGDTFEIRGDALKLLGMRGLYDPNSKSIGLVRFDLSGDLGEMLGRIDRGEVGDVVGGDRGGAETAPATLRGEIAHEVIHALRRAGLIDADVWSRLVAHGKALKVLDSEYRTLLQRIGNANYTTMPSGVTGRELYLDAYSNESKAGQRERLDQETVTHMMELYVANDLLPQEVEPVKAILDSILDGSIWRGGQEADIADSLEVRPMDKRQLHDIAQANYDVPYAIDPVQRVPLSGLTGGAYTQAKVDPLADAIRSNGWIEPLVIDGDGNVIEGQHRLRALQKIGAKDVPVHRIREQVPAKLSAAMEKAAKAAGIRSEHARQIAHQLAEIIDKEGVAALDEYEAPQGFEKAWEAAVAAAKQGELELMGAAQGNQSPANMELQREKAESAGFNTDVQYWHGTGRDLTETGFDLRKAQDKEGRRRGVGLGKGKVYLDANREGGNSWAMAAKDRGLGDNPNVVGPLWVRGPLIDENDYKAEFERISGGRQITDSTLDMAERDRLIAATDKAVKAQGYKGIQTVYRNRDGSVAELGQTAMFNTSDIRHVNADFDPERSASSDLMAATQKGKTRLAALHNLSAENLAFADKMGGIGAPSIAVVKEGMGIEDGAFGDITLIGRKDLGDPSKNPVFDADAWTTRFPRAEYKAAPSGKAQKFVDALRPYAAKFENTLAMHSVWDEMVNQPDPERAVQTLLHSEGAQAMFLDKVKGKRPDPVMQTATSSMRNPWVGMPAFQAYAARHGGVDNGLRQTDKAGWAELSKAVSDAVDEFVAIQGDPAKMEQEDYDHFRSLYRDELFDENGSLFFGKTQWLNDDLRKVGKQQVDKTKSRELLEQAVKPHESEFKSWVENQIVPLYGEPRIKVGGKYQPYTLENIVQFMTGKRSIKAQEAHMTFGPGKARADAAHRMKSLEDARSRADWQMGDSADVTAARERANKLLDDWRNAVVPHNKYVRANSGQRDSFGSTWEALDGAMRAMATWAKGGKTVAGMRSALAREDFTEVPADVLELGVEAGKAFLEAPVPYFESKPQRAVGLKEFAGAVVPANADPATLAILDKHGIPYQTYDKTSRSAQAEAAAKFTQDLAKQGQDTLFAIQRNRLRDQDSLGYYSQALEAARSLKQAKGTPEQMLAQLKTAGVKQAEIEATGLNTFLDGKKSVTRDDIVGHLEGNRVGVKEKSYSRPDGFEDSIGQRMAEWREEQLARGRFDEVRPARSNFWESEKAVDQTTKFLNKEGVRLDRDEVEEDGIRLFDAAGVKITAGDIPVWGEHNGQFFIVEAPNGQAFVTSEYDGTGDIYPSKAEAIKTLENEADSMARDAMRSEEHDVEQQFREDAESRGAPDPTKWSSYSLDPSNPTYRETVLHLPDNRQGVEARRAAAEARIAELDALDGNLTSEQRQEYARLRNGETDRENFRSGHFSEPNIIGHMMTSMTSHEGKPVFTIDQIQSDWGQKLRDGGVRDEAKIKELRKQYEQAQDDLDVALEAGKDEPREQFAQVPFGYDKPIPPSAQALYDRTRMLSAELQTLEASSPGNPLVNTTDQWTNTTLRRAIRMAAEADAEYIAIPSGDTVLSYNPGDTDGMRGFYDGIVPKNLRNIITKLDKASPPPQRIATLDSPSGKTGLGKGFTLFKLTDRVKQEVLDEGQPLFAFGGVQSPEANISAYTEAVLMNRRGASAQEILDATGWYKDKAEKWKFWNEDEPGEPQTVAESRAHARRMEMTPEERKATPPWMEQPPARVSRSSGGSVTVDRSFINRALDLARRARKH